MAREVKQWITVNGQHVPIFEGQSKKEAVDAALKNQKKVNDEEDKKEKQITASKKQAAEKNNSEDVIDKIKNQEYQYHATTGTAVWNIYENGLKPGRGHAGKGIYFAPSAEDALEWTATSSTGGTTLMRVKTKTLKEKYEWDVLDETESTADKKISRKDIEIKKGSEWVSLEDFKKSRETSYRMWKAKS